MCPNFESLPNGNAHCSKEIREMIAMKKIAFNKKETVLIGPAVKEETVDTLLVQCCIIWTGNVDYEEDGKEVSGKSRDMVLEKNGKDLVDRYDYR